MEQKVSFFDAIDSNKRNSILLIGVMMLIFLALIFFLSYAFDVNPIATTVLGFFVLGFYAFISYYAGDKVILTISGAKKAEKSEYPFLYNVVEGLALASAIPMPEVYIIQDESPNAFATGRDPQHASVAVTIGLLKILKREELEGVIAHEISHIANYDIRFMMLTVVFVGAIGLIANLGSRMLWLKGGSRRGKGGGIILIIGLLFMILAPIFAMLVRFAISRQREYLADANGARLTRYPEGLASALEKISGANIPTSGATDVTASMYISNPFKGGISSIFSTHPPANERVKRLRAM